ncbi:MAG TPA: ATP synthase F0 subunit B [Proteobacteria bacterium]|nr:ATP synthase subunit b [bacterium BMS3Abin14]HDL52515.1 ATP synthase F0 subunit B [Pseudomonadota bacterium]
MSRRSVRIILLLACGLAIPAVSLAAGGDGGGGRSIYDLIMRFVNFAILMGILIYFARKPIADGIRGSVESVRKMLNEAEASRQQAEIKMKEAEERLARADQEMDALIKTARQESEMEKERILGEAEEAVERLKKEAKQSILQELKKTQEILRKEAAETAVAIAEEIIRDRVTPDDQSRFVDECLNNLEAAKQ